MQTLGLALGIEHITQWGVNDDLHLPTEGRAAPVFLPKQSEMEGILHPLALDEKVVNLVLPVRIGRDLLVPSVLTAIRHATQQRLNESAERATGQRKDVLRRAGALLGDDEECHLEFQAGLAALYKG